MPSAAPVRYPSLPNTVISQFTLAAGRMHPRTLALCSRLVVLGCLTSACRADGNTPGTRQSTPGTYTFRVAGDDTLRLYVFRPAASPVESARPAIVLVHGGGWTLGSAEWTFEAAREFAREGLVAAAVDYRLSGGPWTPQDALSDVCEALRWVRRHAGDLGIDTTRVAGYGVSAGGHLIASTVTVGCPASDAAERAGVDLLLLWSPAVDVAHDGWFAHLLPEHVDAATLSPAQHINASTPPTSIVQGDSDTITPLARATEFCSALNTFGTRCELNVYRGLGHLLTRNLARQDGDFDPDPTARADGIAKHFAFLRANGF